jgi:hypothetical protein
MRRDLNVQRWVGASVALLMSVVSCANNSGGDEPKTPVTCGGEQRIALNCESEFKYEGRNIEGGFEALGMGSANAKTDEVALRQIDQQTEQYAAQARRLCEEYNACVVDKDTYATRSENLRRRMSKAPELYDGIKAAPDADARRKALSDAYQQLVPDEQRTELAMELAVNAQRPEQSAPVVIGPGTSLPTNTHVSFSVNVSKSAYVYLFQKGPDGAINVLFPDARIPLQNPIPAGTELRIPGAGASFRLNEKDIGTERVYVVASLQALTTFQQSAERVASGQAAEGDVKAVTDMPSNSSASGSCKTRALELEGAPETPCVRSRGLELDSGPSASPAPASLRARTEAADGILAQVFSFEHTP